MSSAKKRNTITKRSKKSNKRSNKTTFRHTQPNAQPNTLPNDQYIRCDGCGGILELCDENKRPLLGKNNEPIYVTRKISPNLYENTPYGERLIEHCKRVRDGIEEPDFSFEDEYDDQGEKICKAEFTEDDEDDEDDEDYVDEETYRFFDEDDQL